MATKPGRMMCYIDWLPPMKLLNPLITWSYRILQDHVKNQNQYISAKTVVIATKPGFIFTCSHHFTLNFYSLQTQGHANSYFNQYSRFREYYFQLWNRFNWWIYLLVRLPTLDQKIPPAKFPISSYLLTLFGKRCLTMWQIKTIKSPLQSVYGHQTW